MLYTMVCTLPSIVAHTVHGHAIIVVQIEESACHLMAVEYGVRTMPSCRCPARSTDDQTCRLVDTHGLLLRNRRTFVW